MSAPRATGTPADLTIRRSRGGDLPALERLAQLDSAAPRAGGHLLAEEDGELRAALPLDGGPAIADPFRRTEELVAMLELRVTRLADPREGERGGLLTRVRALRPRPPAIAREGLGARPLPADTMALADGARLCEPHRAAGERSVA